jgi:hypothetical protein
MTLIQQLAKACSVLGFILLACLGVPLQAKSTQKTVHVVFSNHVVSPTYYGASCTHGNRLINCTVQDLGFGGIGTELGFDNNVFNKFFDEHFPRAVSRHTGSL